MTRVKCPECGSISAVIETPLVVEGDLAGKRYDCLVCGWKKIPVFKLPPIFIKQGLDHKWSILVRGKPWGIKQESRSKAEFAVKCVFKDRRFLVEPLKERLLCTKGA